MNFMYLKMWWVLLGMLSLACAGAPVSEIKKDEFVDFYPAVASWNQKTHRWEGTIHGIVYEVSEGKSAAIKMAALRGLLGLPKRRSEVEEQVFRSRAKYFTVDHERWKNIYVRLQGNVFALGPSAPNGHFYGKCHFSGKAAAVQPVRFRVIMPHDEPRTYGGVIKPVQRVGISVISDIDDTIKESGVLNEKELLVNSFYRPFTAQRGMAELYQDWEKKGAVFHYVTGSPWQLYKPLWSFLKEKGFPGSTITLRHLRLTGRGILRFLDNPFDYKYGAILEQIDRFSDRRFVLIGDSGEQDPKIYGAVYRARPKQIIRIYIRNIDDSADDRFQEDFQGVPAERWTLFSDTDIASLKLK